MRVEKKFLTYLVVAIVSGSSMVVRAYSKKYLAEFVYGATDGTVTTFAIISAVSGALLSPGIVIVLGFANVLADGFSMAASNYLSEKSNQEINGTRGKKKPMKTAVATFVSFVAVGSFPLIPFAALYGNSAVDPFVVSVAVTALVFLIIGFVRGRISGKDAGISAFETLAIGGAASAIAFFVGAWLKGLAG